MPKPPPPRRRLTMTKEIEAAIIHLLQKRAPTSSICPSDVARYLHPHNEPAWRALMPHVREVAAVMQDDKRLRITRGGQDLAPQDLHHGAIRLRRGPGFDTGPLT
jgi:Protein of unknown function (DUF3253)